MPTLLAAADLLEEAASVVIAGPLDHALSRALGRAALAAADPMVTVLRAATPEDLPLRHPAQGKQPGPEGAAAYLCRRGVCGLPITDVDSLAAALATRTLIKFRSKRHFLEDSRHGERGRPVGLRALPPHRWRDTLGRLENRGIVHMAPALQEILHNRVKEKLARDEVVASMTVRLTRSIEIARIAATAGFDTLYVDVEHNSFSIDSVSQICMAALQCDITPLVRVPANTPEFIGRLLDGGALGVIAPHVRSAAEARGIVRQAKFPPMGERGAGGALPHYHYRGFPVAEANQAMNDATIVVIMVETAAALDNVAEIAAVDGVDLLLVGTNDLCNEFGITGQFDHPQVRDAYARTLAGCRQHGKHVGVGGLASRPDLVAEYVRQGARYVSTGTDLGFLLEAATHKADAVREISAHPQTG